jgi:hypothetical protein
MEYRFGSPSDFARRRLVIRGGKVVKTNHGTYTVTEIDDALADAVMAEQRDRAVAGECSECGAPLHE